MALTTTKNISLDFYNNNLVTINAKQLDTAARYVNVTCTDYGKKAVLDPDTMSAFVRYKKSDGHKVFNDAFIQSDGTVQFELTQQMLASEGKQDVDLLIVATPGLTASKLQYELIEDYKEDVTISYYSSQVSGTGTLGWSGLQYADEISINTGKVELISPITVSSPSYANLKDTIKGKYIKSKIGNNTYYYRIPSSVKLSKITTSTPFNTETVKASGAYKLSVRDKVDTLYDLGVTVISTMTFYINVYETAVENQSISSTDEFDALVDAVSRLTVAEKDLQALEDTVESNENKRQSNEKNRQATYNSNKQVLTDCETATSEANAAAEDARNAITNMDTYTQAASDAADRANLAADKCQDIVDASGVIPRTEKGTSGGVATLDSNSKIPVEQINTTFNSQSSEVITSGESFNTILGKTAAYMKAVDKMTQNSSKSNTNYPVLISKSSNPTSGDFTGTYYNTGITANPSKKSIKLSTLEIGDATITYEVVNNEKRLVISFGETNNSSGSDNTGGSGGGNNEGGSDNTGGSSGETGNVEYYINEEYSSEKTTIAQKSGTDTTWGAFKYADKVSVDNNGKLYLINPSTIELPSANNLIGVIEGKYISSDFGTYVHYFKIPETATITTTSTTSPKFTYVCSSEVYVVTAKSRT